MNTTQRTIFNKSLDKQNINNRLKNHNIIENYFTEDGINKFKDNKEYNCKLKQSKAVENCFPKDNSYEFTVKNMINKLINFSEEQIFFIPNVQGKNNKTVNGRVVLFLIDKILEGDYSQKMYLPNEIICNVHFFSTQEFPLGKLIEDPQFFQELENEFYKIFLKYLSYDDKTSN